MEIREKQVKIPYVASSFLRALKRKQAKAKEKGGVIIVHTRARSTTILPEFVNMVIYVHNGKKYIPVQVTEKHVGHKLGEFAPTRTFKGHSGNKSGKK